MSDTSGYSLNRPNAIRTATNKYGPSSPIAPQLAAMPASVRRALQNYDANRANLGQSSLTRAQTVRAGSALGSLQINPLGPLSTVHADATTPAPDRPWWQDAGADIQQILSAVPKVPFLLANEADQLRHIGTTYDELPSADNPLEQLGNVAQLPGVRLTPGSFVASQFGTGGQGIGGLTEHPVMTALDVLPYAQKAAQLAPSVAMAEDVAQRAAVASGGLPARTTPLSSVFKYGIRGSESTAPQFGMTGPEIPTMNLSPVARAMSTIPRALQGGPVGGFVESAFGKVAREGSRLQNRASSDLEQLINDPENYVAPGLTDGPNEVAVRAAARAVKDSGDLSTEFKDLTVEQRVGANDTIRSGDQTQVTALSPRQLEYTERYRSYLQPLTDAMEAGEPTKLGRVEFPHGPEMYDASTQARVNLGRHAESSQLAAANLRDTLNPETTTRMTPAELVDDLRTAMADPAIHSQQATILARGYLQALRGQGVAVGDAVNDLVRSNTRATRAALADSIDLSAPLLPRPSSTVESIAAALEPLSRRSAPINRFVTNLKRGDVEAALKDASAISKNRAAGDLLSESGIDLADIRAVAADRRAVLRADRGLDRVGFNSESLRHASERRVGIERRAVPARFQTAVQNEAMPKMVAAVNEASANGVFDAAQTAELTTLINNRMFPQARTMFPELADIQRSARDSWIELAEQGFDPQFVHNVAPDAARAVQYPRVADHITSPGQFKARLWDGGGRANELEVALSHQGMDYLISQGNRAYVDAMIDGLAVPASDIRSRFLRAAQDAHAKNPEINLEAHLDQLIRKSGLVGWDPQSFITGRTTNATPYYINRGLAKNLESLRAAPSDIGRAVGAPMNLFRTAVLPLSPRWHVNNILGGAITVTAAAENPLTLWSPRRVMRAAKMAREGGPDSVLRDASLTVEERAAARLGAPGGNTRQNFEWMRDKLRKESTEHPLNFLHNTSVGKLAQRLNFEGWASRPVNAGKSFVQWSYDKNQLVDDFYRSLAYAEGSDRALTKGLSRAEQIKAGVQTARKVMQNWDTLTPIERSTMRMVFPFYSWTRFMLKYVLTYPGDHPWRTEILSALSRTEGHDYGTGIPTDLQTLLFLGEPDKDGKISAINTAGFNPFRDTANYATLAGFMAGNGDVSAITSQVNPLLSTALEWAGVDPASGMADLYPEMQYDPTTGRLIAVPKSNPVLGAAGNFLPQLNAVTAFAGINEEYRQMAAQDPAAAGRYLMSTMGVPILRRDVDLNRQIIGGEVTRYNSQRTALTDAMASGNYSQFNRQYPGMRALTDRIQVLSRKPDFISQYGMIAGRRGTSNPSPLEALGAAS